MDAIDIHLCVAGRNYRIGMPPKNEKIYYHLDECTRIGDPVVKNRPLLGVADWESVYYRHARGFLLGEDEEYREVIGDYILFLKDHHKEFIENGVESIELCIWMHTTSNSIQRDLLMPSEVVELVNHGITSISFDVIHYSRKKFKEILKTRKDESLLSKKIN